LKAPGIVSTNLHQQFMNCQKSNKLDRLSLASRSSLV
jgi:hypothetical protein